VAALRPHEAGPWALLAAVHRDDHVVIIKEAAMFVSLINRVTAPFHRKRCPECGHKVRETYCDVCGYKLVEQTHDNALYRL
jgi:hypothetical protein